MNDFFLNLLFTIAGIFIGRLGVLMRPRKDLDPGTIKGDLDVMTHQIVAFNELESHFVKELATVSGKSEDEVRASFRQKVVAEGYKMPEMSAVEARRILKKHAGDLRYD